MNLMTKRVLLKQCLVYSLIATLLVTICWLLPTPIFADFTIIQPNNGGIHVGTQTGPNILQTIISNVVTIFFTFAGIATLMMFLWGAIEWILSGGDKEKVGAARKRIVNAIIGLVLIALAFVIIRVIGQIIDFNPLGNLSLPSLNKTPQQECEGRGAPWFWNPGLNTCSKNPTEPGR